MKNYFWITTSFVLLAIISVLAGFTAKGIDFTAYTPWLSIKCALLLSVAVLLIQLPAIIVMFIENIGKSK
ncbi:hypothetical protein ANG_1949 [Streptococcus anginosus subsp. whileyi MAS624]|uniref:hypothetical protein n=1 Tax=Streptococcus anginosus TaxID=1328 RepID=UPI0003549DF8|nr:hypothetical protein [Streptococcus anginosus]BAN62419.1 hypothetical protein ANG_1949 [Streptococcus anginosus subsp. whileyi MAS624]